MAYCNLDKVIYDGVGKYDIPELEPVRKLPDIKYWLGFNYVKQDYYCRSNVGVHFYLDDYQFETIWNQPTKYIDKLKKCGCVIQPDFSMYTDFPKAMQIYNKYRNHWLAKYYQDRGVCIIPCVMWSSPDTYDWCFDGYPEHSTIAIETIGTVKDKVCHDLFLQGFNEVVNRLKPIQILLFSTTDNIDKDELKFDNIKYINTSTFKHKPQNEMEKI